jgi:Pyruvate/2-oxoacid:ferredoxin oxidoreductase delta subunit
MGHLAGKDIFKRLGKKIDGLTVRVPWNDTLHEILKELYSADDADLIVKMPFNFSTIERIEATTGIPHAGLQRQLESLCSRGLVMDVCVENVYYYVPSPMMLGLFEFTIMRTGGLDHDKVTRLFQEYLDGGVYWKGNFGQHQHMPLVRTVPHETPPAEEYVEVLDYEKAEALIDGSTHLAMGVCACRHEQEHLGQACGHPMDNCSSLGALADYLIRNGLAREVSQTEMRENVARSRERGLVLTVDNVQRNVNFMCHCCACCCRMIQGITRYGYANIIVSSTLMPEIRQDRCKGCGTCVQRCPIQAISLVPDADPRFAKRGRPQVDEAACLGCSVCAVACRSNAIQMRKREQRVFHPATTFERTIIQCLERGTLQNQLFDDPGSKSQSFLRGLIGGFLRLPPVKQVLMSDAVRSRFLDVVRRGAVKKGLRDLTEI